LLLKISAPSPVANRWTSYPSALAESDNQGVVGAGDVVVGQNYHSLRHKYHPPLEYIGDVPMQAAIR
ncbi:MAG: hypothetical protein ACPL3C_10035, partial [Pyrobaculum sp.]